MSELRTLCNELRIKKERPYDPQTAFNGWVEEYAYVHNMSISEVLELALFKQENMEYTGVKE